MPQGDSQQHRKRKNLALLVILLALMALFYAITIMKMGAISGA